MNIKLVVLTFLLSIYGLVYGQSTSSSLQLSGTVIASPAKKVYLQKFQNKMFFTIDSAVVEHGKFQFTTSVELPELYGLTLDPSKSPLYVFLENNNIEVSLDSSAYYEHSKVIGSTANDLFTAYKLQRRVQIDQFIQEHPKSIVSAYILYRDFSYRLTPDEIRHNIQLLDPSLHTSPYVNILQELVPVLESVQVGKKAPDFSALDPDGKTIKLSDHLGKYLLVDFWAAWCGPCRRENPNVVKAFQKYKDKGFDVFGVSLDKNKDAWIKAIQHDGLTWTQVSDLAYWNSAPAKLYGVRAIPANFLIDPSGIIIARNLRGEALEEKLNELLK